MSYSPVGKRNDWLQWTGLLEQDNDTNYHAGLECSYNGGTEDDGANVDVGDPEDVTVTVVVGDSNTITPTITIGP